MLSLSLSKITILIIFFLFFAFCFVFRLCFFQYWEKAKFPFHVIPKLGALCVAGGTIKVLSTHSFLYTLDNTHGQGSSQQAVICRVMAVLAFLLLAVLYQLLKSQELMQAVQLLFWSIHPWQCSLLVTCLFFEFNWYTLSV